MSEKHRQIEVLRQSNPYGFGDLLTARICATAQGVIDARDMQQQDEGELYEESLIKLQTLLFSGVNKDLIETLEEMRGLVDKIEDPDLKHDLSVFLANAINLATHGA